MKFHLTTSNIPKEVREAWNKFSQSNGTLKRPFTQGPNPEVTATNVKLKPTNKKWNPPR